MATFPNEKCRTAISVGLQYLTRIMIERLFAEGWQTKIKTAKVPDIIIGISFRSPITLASGSMAASTPKQKQDQ